MESISSIGKTCINNQPVTFMSQWKNEKYTTSDASSLL